MRQRLSQPTEGRQKRWSFIHQRKILDMRCTLSVLSEQEDILDHNPKEIIRVLPFLPVVKELPTLFGVPSLVLVRKTPKAARESSLIRKSFNPLPTRVLDSCVDRRFC